MQLLWVSFFCYRYYPGVHLSCSELTRRAGIFLISIFGVQVHGVATPNLLISVLMFFDGVCQFISGIIEFVSGNTVRNQRLL